MPVFRVGALPDAPLAAASQFYGQCLPQLRVELVSGNDPVAIVFAGADYRHRGWRTEAVASLAREVAPRRINAVAGDDSRAIAAAIDWLERAPGVTGQLLRLDSQGAGEVIG